MATQAKITPRTGDTPWLVVMVILVIAGIAAWIVQLTQGMTVIGTGQTIVWGVYIANFFFLAGIAGGLVALAALSDLDVIPALQPKRRVLLLGAVAAFIAAGFMILMDIGMPGRVFNMIISPNFSSPFVWDFACLALGVILAAVLLYVGPRVKWLSAIAGIIAILVIAVEGWILSMSAGSALWHGGMMPAMFLCEGMIAASALALLAAPPPEAANWLRRALLWLLPSLLLFNLFEITAVVYAGSPDAQAAATLMLRDPLYWVQVTAGIVIPFVLLAWGSKNQTSIVTAAVLAILGVLVAKFVVLIAGQAVAFLRGLAGYTPSLVEIGGVIGMIGLAGLLFILGERIVPEK